MVNSLYQTWSNRNEVMLSQFRSKQHTVHGALLQYLEHQRLFEAIAKLETIILH